MDKVKKKRRSRWKRYTIPEDIKSQLSDQALSSIERVQLAEKCRKQYSCNREDMLALTGISNTQSVLDLHLLSRLQISMGSSLRG